MDHQKSKLWGLFCVFKKINFDVECTACIADELIFLGFKDEMNLVCKL